MANKYQYQTVPYNPPSVHPFHTLDVWCPNPTEKALWIIFIHGGAWCDPTATKTQGHPLLTHLLTYFPTSLLNAASIDYRLSPHSTRAPVGETVTHPGHLEDVQAALRFLDDTYQMRHYILIGHSAGATLSFQTLGSGTPCTKLLPRAVVGLAGIYDLRALVVEYPDYRGFVERAFGVVSKEVGISPRQHHPWDYMSPAKDPVCEGYKKFFEGKHRILLVQSTTDQLLSTGQTLLMERALVEGFATEGVLETVIGDFGMHVEMLVDSKMWGEVERVVRVVLEDMNATG